MRYQVPQNVQREDTILGPLTIKQLIIAIIGFGFAWIMWTTLDPTVATPIIIVIVAFTVCLLFIRIASMPFHQYLMEVMLFLLKPRIRVWQKGTGELSPFDYLRVQKKKKAKTETADTAHPKETRSLSELSKVLDTHGRWNKKDLQETAVQKEVDELSDAEFFGKTMGR